MTTPRIFINFPAEITRYEGATRGEVIYSFSAYDNDSSSNSELRYELLNRNFNGTLTVNPFSGQLIASVNKAHYKVKPIT